MKIIIVRHGQSEANSKGFHQGREDEWTDTILSEEGVKQAIKVAERLSEEKIDVIYSSSFKRARMTAEEIARYHNLEIFTDNRITDQLDKENHEDIIKRCGDFLGEILEENKNIAVVAHGSINLALMVLITKMNREEGGKFFEETSQHNTCVNILEKENDKFVLKLVNCIKHRGSIEIKSKWENKSKEKIK